MKQIEKFTTRRWYASPDPDGQLEELGTARFFRSLFPVPPFLDINGSWNSYSRNQPLARLANPRMAVDNDKNPPSPQGQCVSFRRKANNATR
jgi:hypothetical protein